MTSSADNMSSQRRSRSLSRTRIQSKYSENTTTTNGSPMRLARRGRSVSRGRKSLLVEKMIKKQTNMMKAKADAAAAAANQVNNVVDEKQQASKSKNDTLKADQNQATDKLDESAKELLEDLATNSKDDPLDLTQYRDPTFEEVESASTGSSLEPTTEVQSDVVETQTSIKAEHDSTVVDASSAAVENTVTDEPSMDQEGKKHEDVSELLQENVARHNEQFDEYDDPPLEEMESEVSVGFDMRSIHDNVAADDQAVSKNDSDADKVKAWASSNVVFEDSSDEKEEHPSTVRELSHETFPAIDVVEEKKEKEIEDIVEPTQNDLSWDTSNQHFPDSSTARSIKSTADDVDMFDTSSWAVGTEARFSDVSISKLASNADSDSHFVKFMTEEMKCRELTDDERKMLFEAQRNVQDAEEKMKLESMKEQKDDVPLIGQPSSSTDDDDVAAEQALPLEDRLKMYAVSGEPDEESLDGDEDADPAENDDYSDDGAAGPQVEYVGHEDVEVEAFDFPTEWPSESEQGMSVLVSSEDVPSLDINGMTNSACEEEKSRNIHSSYESLRSIMPPPPPPPGQPKKKKRGKSKSKKSRSVPLIAPPPEEKLKKWEESKMRAQNYVSAMKESLEKSDTKALDASLEFFQQSSQESALPDETSELAERTVPHEISDENLGNADQAVDDATATEVVKTNTSLSALSEDTLEGQREIADKPRNSSDTIDDQGEKANECSPDHDDQYAEYDEAAPSLEELDPVVHEADHTPEEQYKEFDEAAALSEELPTDNAEEIVLQESKQPSLFSSPGGSSEAKLSKVFSNKAGHSSPDDILSDPKMADKLAFAIFEAAVSFEETYSRESSDISPIHLDEFEVFSWFSVAVLKQEMIMLEKDENISDAALSLLEDKQNFNALCQYIAENINNLTMLLRPGIEHAESVLSSFDESTVVSAGTTTVASFDDATLEQKRPLLKAFVVPDDSVKVSPIVLAANCISFFALASKLTKEPSPFGDRNPFLTMIVESSLTKKIDIDESKTAQELLFDEIGGQADLLVDFVYRVKCSCDADMRAVSDEKEDNDPTIDEDDVTVEASTRSRRFVVPDGHPSPFETSVSEVPRIVAVVLSFLGDPAAVCRMKMVNRYCHRIVSENEHMLMQNAVRAGGIEMSVRPAFWMWVALQKSDTDKHHSKFNDISELQARATEGEEGKWHHVIQRDVDRSFGNLPPHKTRSKLRNDSIVRALVTWGQNRIMKRGVKGGGEPFPTPDIGPNSSRKMKGRPQSPTTTSPPWEANDEEASIHSDDSETPTDTVSDWGGVSPKGSFANDYDNTPEKLLSTSATDISSAEELALALSGNSLTAEAKVDLRNKLSFILHTMAATHEDIGYCQGMDYVVAHLLRILQETVKWQAANHTLPSDVISTASLIDSSQPVRPEDYKAIYEQVDRCLVVEETIIRVMDTFFINYNLKHMYWPELRCLKTCCRVFERLIQIKLPVLADHFEHHDLNVGLFALGWFQTLFLYLPSMPSATVCHMWDIWLVERSFKIFFRVGTAILFLSQPTLLNHELEGMMTYLNTIPDSTLLRPDILIPCALNIKVTNRMLQELETEVMQHP